AGHDLLLPLDRDGRLNQMTSVGPGPLVVAIMAGALILFWRTTQFRTVLQVSLGVAFFALLLDCAVTIAGAGRYAIGWYVGRMYGAVSSAMLL
ncbi:MASE4 domain-containing protein, partial [Pseudomonas aeruginosa]|uniref:MASE4 domain-containing protein n=1 Tax=Pseudomonas aeruginosa TaxID=287 RepID=UPI002B4115AE